ncbi:LysR substrate-binding domain-containing protein [Xylophilus sp.]|uniref:LysR substrate-binding domain-containing protein n=1 Tax=Xylophilus sp. TaxID=2653893 RepID=UPI0013B96F12|nr:LysR substrate-binding domain-containing protein [Xylophilus sp.]KAF1042493.1 MAG: Hydrogen peroxide-inducible genes activator [Xylophilus sp.]
MNILVSMRYLAALHEHRHFGRAAQACGITQPALSNALRALEAEFGAVIVRRGRTYAGLTHEGEQVLRTARRMLHEHEQLRQNLSAGGGRLQGTLRMAAVPTAVPVLARFAALLQAREPGIVPVVLSMSSLELETGLESLALDLALGYTGRTHVREVKVAALPQYTEHYFFVRRAAGPQAATLRIGAPLGWREAAAHRLCLLTREMHNRAIVDEAFAQAGAPVQPAIETNSVLALALAVAAGEVCAVLPGAVLAAVRGYRDLEALPLVAPEVHTPIGCMVHASERPSRALEAALAVLASPPWQAHRDAHAGAVGG